MVCRGLTRFQVDLFSIALGLLRLNLSFVWHGRPRGFSWLQNLTDK